MSRVVVTGAGGFIGRAAIRALAEAGHAVVAIVRHAGAAPAFPENVETIALAGLVEAPDALLAAMRGADIVIHLADDPRRTQAGENGSASLAHAVADAAETAGVPRLIFASSIYAALDARGQGNAYGAGKRAAEDLLFARSGFATTVLRLPPVYGPGAKGGIAMLAGLVRRGLPLPFASATAPRDYLALANLAALLVALVRSSDEAFARVTGRTWEPSDGAPIGTAALAGRIGEAMGRKSRLVAVPQALLALPASLFGRRAQVEAVFAPLAAADDAELRAAIGWHPSPDWRANLAYLAG